MSRFDEASNSLVSSFIMFKGITALSFLLSGFGVATAEDLQRHAIKSLKYLTIRKSTLQTSCLSTKYML